MAELVAIIDKLLYSVLQNKFLVTYVTELIKWYLLTIVYYPAIITSICIAAQYICPPGYKIRFLACYGVYIMWTTTISLIIWPFFVINSPAGLANCLYGATLLKPVANIIGMEFVLKNYEILSEKTGPAVVVANHQSFFDVLGMFTQWHVMGKCTAIARKKVFWVWPFGLLAWIAGVVFIDRVPQCEETHKKVNKAADYISKKGAKLWIFAEGTRNRHPEKLLPFKKGAFRVAITCQLPIIPVVYSPYYFINGKEMYFGKGRVIMEALDPVSTQGLTLANMDELILRVHRMMSEKNEEKRSELKKLKTLGQLPYCVNL